MAANDVSGDYGFVTQMTCVLKEGNITYNSSGYGPFGKMAINTLASEIKQFDVVSLSPDTANTADATDNNPVVTLPANGVDLAFGIVIDVPKWVRQPSASQSTWSTMLSGGYYRIATVALFIPMSVYKATLVCANAAAIVPGTAELIDIDASASLAANGLSVVDVASGGSANMIPLTYVAQAASGSFSVLIGFNGFGTVTT